MTYAIQALDKLLKHMVVNTDSSRLQSFSIFISHSIW